MVGNTPPPIGDAVGETAGVEVGAVVGVGDGAVVAGAELPPDSGGVVGKIAPDGLAGGKSEFGST